MNQKRIFLSPSVNDYQITSILESAIDEKHQLTFLEHDTGIERKLTTPELAAIRSNGPKKKTAIKLQPTNPSVYGLRSQEVGYNDLRIDETNLTQIQKGWPYLSRNTHNQGEKENLKYPATKSHQETPVTMGQKGADATNAVHYEAKERAIEFTIKYCEKNPKARKHEVAQAFKLHAKSRHSIKTIEEWVKSHVLNRNPGRPNNT